MLKILYSFSEFFLERFWDTGCVFVWRCITKFNRCVVVGSYGGGHTTVFSTRNFIILKFLYFILKKICSIFLRTIGVAVFWNKNFKKEYKFFIILIFGVCLRCGWRSYWNAPIHFSYDKTEGRCGDNKIFSREKFWKRVQKFQKHKNRKTVILTPIDWLTSYLLYFVIVRKPLYLYAVKSQK